MSPSRLSVFLIVLAGFTVARTSGNTASSSGICFPDGIEGYMNEVFSTTRTFFAVDYVGYKFFTTADPESDVFDIYDFGNGYHTSFNGDSCRTVGFVDTRQIRQCLENDLGLPDLTLGYGSNGVDVRNFGFEVQGRPRSFLVKANADGVYLPFLLHDYVGQNRSRTTLFSEVVPYISNRGQRINSDISDCVYDNWMWVSV